MMNILLIILLLILVWRVVVGAKRGMVKELLSFIDLIFASLVLTLVFMIYRGYTMGQKMELVPLIIAIVVLSVVYAIIKLVFSPAKLIAKLPVVKSVNKILGVVIGALEVVIIYWILCCVLKYIEIAPLQEFVAPMIDENSVLASLRQNNLLDKLLTSILGSII